MQKFSLPKKDLLRERDEESCNAKYVPLLFQLEQNTINAKWIFKKIAS